MGGRKHRDPLFLGAVRESDSVVDCTPLDVHEALTRHFQEWYANPNIYKEDQLHTGQWEEALRSFPAFYATVEHTGVPEDLCHLIYEAIRRSPGDAISTHLAELFTTTPSFDEFTAHVRKLRNNSAPGMSGCSYNMIKSWPEPVLRAAYDSVAIFWQNRAIPDYWRWRWLVPIPKKTTDTPLMADLRPLMLTEASRKVWTSLIVEKIQDACRTYHILRTSQHGYQRNRGTDSASLMFINLIESSQWEKNTSHRTSYDMSRAFDSISKNLMRIAWRRLGVPGDVADWLVEMDIGGVTVVRSPLAQERWETDGYLSVTSYSIPPSVQPADMVYQKYDVRPFVCARGTGQGNPDSPTCWNAVFDIALTALEMDAEYRATVHYAAGADGTSYESSEVGYADDLVSLHDTATEIQRKAEVMSAFCVICGVTMSHKKLRRAVQDWLGVRHLPSDFSMKIYEYGWTARDITVKIDGATEFLGGQHDLITIGSTQEVSALDVTRQHCNVIDRTYASGTTKLMCLSVSTVPKILYKHNLNSISLNRYQKTDKICYPVILSACKHLWGFPKALLHLPPSYCGLGVDSITDRTFQKK